MALPSLSCVALTLLLSDCELVQSVPEHSFLQRGYDHSVLLVSTALPQPIPGKVSQDAIGAVSDLGSLSLCVPSPDFSVATEALCGSQLLSVVLMGT